MAVGTAMAIGAAAAPVLGGVIGNIASAGDRKRAQEAYASAMEKINAVGAPPDLSKEIILQEFRQVGALTPELEQAINIDSSQVSQIQEDQGLKDAQRGALTALQQRGKVGLTPEDRLSLAQIQQETQAQAEGKRQQIIQNMQARGMGGAGAELAAALAGSQGAADQASMRGMQVGAQASQNALQAMAQSGQLAGSIAGQEFSRAQTKASAADELARFNNQNQMGVQQRNVGSKNQAQEYNLGTAQQIANQNVTQANQEKYRQAQAAQDYWRNQLSLAQTQANALTGQGQQLGQQAGQTAQMWSGIGSGVGAGVGGVANYMGQQDANKLEREKFAYNKKMGYQG